ncbi:ParB N-terminal domain-containing protein [Methylosinus sp. KRF6]|uniref:ParB/RepB/Spo0J family partition protein n=1 Tax=Methylosinus sp. KRF6 TaxID=2846853 RepID=UPI001C0E46A2|nr:ParB N-terminal domain-containing protein [Methylosinus sp. KRF6]MBU3890092.1 ParB N-terminal domain-containing protein [Methylosinus sp. KRF6]
MTETIRLDEIDATNRLRTVNPAHVELIAASIEQQGLSQPIVVRPRSPEEGDGLPYILVVGGHREAAMRSLDWKELTIDKHVLVRDLDPLDARLIEIDENVARHELNALDRALFLLERKEVYEKRRIAALGRGGDRKSAKFQEKINSESFRIDFSERFTEDSAKRTGYSESAIQKAITLARRLDERAIRAIRGTPLEDNQTELFQLADLQGDQQRIVAERIKSGEAKTVAQAKVAAGLAKPLIVDPQKSIYSALHANWDKATKQTRATFLKEIGAEMTKRGGAGA